MRKHPAARTLEDFMRDELPAPDRRVVVRHLLAGCAECLRVTSRLWILAEGSGDASFDAAPLAEDEPGSGRGSEGLAFLDW